MTTKLNRDELIKTLRELATPIDFDGLIKSGVLTTTKPKPFKHSERRESPQPPNAALEGY